MYAEAVSRIRQKDEMTHLGIGGEGNSVRTE